MSAMMKTRLGSKAENILFVKLGLFSKAAHTEVFISTHPVFRLVSRGIYTNIHSHSYCHYKLVVEYTVNAFTPLTVLKND